MLLVYFESLRFSYLIIVGYIALNERWTFQLTYSNFLCVCVLSNFSRKINYRLNVIMVNICCIFSFCSMNFIHCLLSFIIVQYSDSPARLNYPPTTWHVTPVRPHSSLSLPPPWRVPGEGRCCGLLGKHGGRSLRCPSPPPPTGIPALLG